MKIVNKKKFIKNILIVIGIILLFSLFLINKCFSYTEKTYKVVLASSGDTLWNIAKEEKEKNNYFKDKSIRDIVDEIKYENNLNNSNLRIGDKLNIPLS